MGPEFFDCDCFEGDESRESRDSRESLAESTVFRGAKELLLYGRFSVDDDDDDDRSELPLPVRAGGRVGSRR
jgi:hypothetical protein